ncbi:MAG: flagellar hook-associated protein FlgL, partial [Candidatus Eisenbacteria bacterium]
MAIQSLPFSSSTFSRVSGVLSRNVVMSNVFRTSQEILRLQEQLASGRELLRPSDDPIAAGLALDYAERIRRNDQLLRNIDSGVRRLEIADGVMSEVESLVMTAQTILLDQMSDHSTEQTRRLASEEVDQLLKKAMDLANSKFEGRYLFAGAQTRTMPFSWVGGAVLYQGDGQELTAHTSDASTTATHLAGVDAFGALSNEIRSGHELVPDLSGATKLADLNGGAGVRAGSVLIGNGASSVTVDLSQAETVQDVLDLINQQAVPAGIATASIDPVAGDRIVLTPLGAAPNDTVFVREVLGGRHGEGPLSGAVRHRHGGCRAGAEPDSG